MIEILYRTFETQTRTGEDLPSLFACIGEKVKVTTRVAYENILFCSVNDDAIVYYQPPSYIAQSADNTNMIAITGAPDFMANLQVGDVIATVDTTNGSWAGNGVEYTVLEKIDDTRFRVDGTLITNGKIGGEDSDEGYIINKTELKSIVLKYGLVGNYNSKTDGSEQKAIGNFSDALYLLEEENLILSEPLTWQTDTITIIGQGDGVGTQQIFDIVHEFVVTPLFLAEQYSDIVARKSPEYWKPTNDIKYISRYELARNQYDISGNKFKDVEGVGKFGWYNTKFDGSKPAYKIDFETFEITKGVDEQISTLQYQTCTVKFDIVKQSTGAAGEFRLVFGFNYLPELDIFYRNNGRDLLTNYVYDSLKVSIADGEVNGEYFGTAAQVIKTLEVISSDGITFSVTAVIDFGSDRQAILKQGDHARYALWAICEDIDLDIEIADKTSLLVQVDEIFTPLVTIDLLDTQTLFIEHPYDENTYGQTELTMFPTDDLVANTEILLDYTGHEYDNIKILSVNPRIVLKKDNKPTITLENNVIISTVSSQTVGENPAVQALSYSQELFYKNDAIRNTVLLGRDLINDDGLIKAWALSYPFMNRWEYWLQVFGVANIPDDLFDNTVPFDGMNNLWDRLASIEGWVLNYRIRFVIEQNGQQFEQIIDTPLASTYFNSNTDWINCRLKSYDITDISFSNPLENGSTKYLYNNDKVRIRAEFEKVGTPLGLDRIAIVLFCESFEGNGEREICLISSVRDVRTDSFFVAENGIKRVQITQDGNVFFGTAVLDGNKLKGRKYTLYGRIYELVEGEYEDGRITNDLILRELLNGEIRFIL